MRQKKRFARTILKLSVENGRILCALIASESEETIGNLDNAITQGNAYIITHEFSDAWVFKEHAVPILIIEKADTADYHGFEAATHCTVLRLGGTDFSQTKESILLREAGPMQYDIENQFQYMW